MGGDVILNKNDIDVTDAIFNQIYLAWFGGNVEQEHEDPEDRESGEQRLGYWQNDLFYKDEYDFHLNGRVERALNNLAMTSQGVYDLELTASEDLEFLSSFGEIEVNVEIIGNDKINLSVKIQQSNEETDILVNFVYDATKQELIENRWL